MNRLTLNVSFARNERTAQYTFKASIINLGEKLQIRDEVGIRISLKRAVLIQLSQSNLRTSGMLIYENLARIKRHSSLIDVHTRRHEAGLQR